MCHRPTYTGGDAITEPYPYTYTNPNPFTLSDAIAHSVTPPDPFYQSVTHADAYPSSDPITDPDPCPHCGMDRNAERRHPR